MDESIETAIAEEVNIEGLGEFSDFDPHSDTSLWPEGGGVYVFYDISHRPIYVGQSGNIQRRLKGLLGGYSKALVVYETNRSICIIYSSGRYTPAKTAGKSHDLYSSNLMQS